MTISDKMVCPQKNFYKKLLKNFRPQCRCRTFAPDLKVKAPQTVVRLSSEGSRAYPQPLPQGKGARPQMKNEECRLKNVD